MKNIAVLGSTGSIGTQTLDVVREQKDLRVVSLAAHKNVDLIFEQIQEFHPEMAVLYEEEKALELKKKLDEHNIKVKVSSGMEGLNECACLPKADMVVAAMVGMIGIRPVLSAVNSGKDIALANKETLVTAGHLIIPAIKEKKTALLPVDSEHSAIFQCLRGYEDRESQVRRIILTASGGAFRDRDLSELSHATVEEALNHPNWSMGKKITVDSATMVNKGLEVIEAHWLFDVDYDKISVVIQPQSVVHSMVEFEDGAVMAQLGTPDMRLPIQYALCYPDRKKRDCDRLDFSKAFGLDFYPPDTEKFPALLMAYEAGRMGHGLPVVFNAANEWEAGRFLKKEETYMGIIKGIRLSMDWWKEKGIYEMNLINREPGLDEILMIEKKVRELLESRQHHGV